MAEDLAHCQADSSLEKSSMKLLPSSTIRMIASSQVITSVYSVVKELVENSLDASASTIEIKLENYGLDKIELRDNGVGVPEPEVEFMCQPHYTSKLSATEDLADLESYGFRGEALGSLCAVADLAVTTKTQNDRVSKTFLMDHKGCILKSVPSHCGQGTTILVANLFKNLPVRKQFYNTAKKKKDELKKIENLIISYGIIRPSVRFSVKHNKETVWQKGSMADTRSVLLSVLGTTTLNQLQPVKKVSLDPDVKFEAFLPKKTSSTESSTKSTNEKSFIYVNHRPVSLKFLEKFFRTQLAEILGHEKSKWPVMFLHLILPPGDLDVNVDPNKSQVMLHNQSAVLEFIKSTLEDLYEVCTQTKDPTAATVEPRKSPVHSTRPETGLLAENSDHSSVSAPHSAEINNLSDIHVHDSVSQNSAYDLQTTADAGSSIFNGEESDKPYMSSTQAAVSMDTSSDLSKNIENMDVPTPTRFDVSDIPPLPNLTDAPRFSLMNDDDDDDDLFLVDPMSQKCHTDKPGSNTAKDQKVAQIEGEIGNSVGIFHTKTNVEPFTKNTGHTCSTTSAENITEYVDTEPNLAEDADIPGRLLIEAVQNYGKTPPLKVTDRIVPIEISPTVDDKVSETSSAAGIAESDPAAVVKGSGVDWSKGTLLGTKAKPVEPVKLFVPRANGSAQEDNGNSSINVSNADKSLSSSCSQSTLLDFVANAPGDRPSVGFIYFSKEIRPRVLEKNCDSNLADIARIIREKWKALPGYKRDEYEELSKREQLWERERQKVKEKSMVKMVQQAQKRRKLELSSRRGSIEKLLLKCEKTPKNEIKTVTCEFKMDRLNDQTARASRRADNSGSDFQLIGAIQSHHVWIGQMSNQLTMFNPIRAQEVLIYHQLLSSHVLPFETIDAPVKLNHLTLGSNELWDTLQSLNKSCPEPTDPFLYYTDSRLMHNGFKIRQNKTSSADEDIRCELIGVARCINFYGVYDLKEILEVIRRDLSSSVHESRPLKAKQYLQGEAVRMARSRPQTVTRDEADDILCQIGATFPADLTRCFHNKPFLYRLFDLDDVPLTQEYMSYSQAESQQSQES